MTKSGHLPASHLFLCCGGTEANYFGWKLQLLCLDRTVLFTVVAKNIWMKIKRVSYWGKEYNCVLKQNCFFVAVGEKKIVNSIVKLPKIWRVVTFICFDLKYLQIMSLKEALKCVKFYKVSSMFMDLFMRWRAGLLKEKKSFISVV